MAMKWNNPNFDKTVEEAREALNTRKALRLSQIKTYLKEHDIKYTDLPTEQGDIDNIIKVLDNGGIVIALVDIGFTW
jgi:lauroyl/myristoyl acyltransferase